MSSRRKRGGPKTEARHVRLYHMMLRTEAWRSLDACAKALYVEIAARYRGIGSNNGRIPYSVREAAKALKVGKTRAALAFERLRERGFIFPETKGVFSRKVRHATEWRLTEFASDVSPAWATKEYEQWRPAFQNTVPEAGPTVPDAGPFGTRRRTEAA
jgi:hypothetical protein